jgi:23S rRNA pseudouridine955/2504/2580 synthase
MKSVIVGKNDAGQRLDKFLTKKYKSLPKSMMFKQIRKKNIKINKKRCTAEQIINENDLIELYLNDDLLIEKKKHYDFVNAPKELDIIYEDENIILLNKKQGELCHPDGKEYVNTLIASLKRYLYESKQWNPDEENSFVPSLANRIDRNTGGIVIGAKNYEALKILNKKIKDREIDKFYLTVAHGKFEKSSGTIESYLVKDEKKNIVSVTDNPTKNAKKAITKYTVLDYYDDVSLVEIELLTGRTHQIRVHLASIGHPLYNDGKYGKVHGRFKQELYSYKLKFNFKTDGEKLNYLNGKEFSINNCPIVEKFKEKKY